MAVIEDEGDAFELSEWEADKDGPTPTANEMVAKTAIAVHLAITAHRPIDDAEDWSAVEAFLPAQATPLARAIIEKSGFVAEPITRFSNGGDAATAPSLTGLNNPQPSTEEMGSEIERLRNENAALRQANATGITMRVSQKGGLSIYGMQHFPITLYKGQWLKLLDMTIELRAFIKSNDLNLKTKAERFRG